MDAMGLIGEQCLRRRYRTMEGAANRLQKEAKGYLDSLRGKGTRKSDVWGFGPHAKKR